MVGKPLSFPLKGAENTMTRTQAKGLFKRAYNAFAAESMVFLIAYLAVLVGLPIIIDPVTFAPSSIQYGLSEWIVRLWGVSLLAGGLLSAGGLFTDRARVERAGLALLFTGAIIYAVLIVVYFTSWSILVPVLTYLLFAWSSIARYRKLGKVLDAINLADMIVHPPCDKQK
jgi:hypothetical protein